MIGSDLTYDDENNVKLFETLEILFLKYKNLLMILAFTMFKNTDDAFLEKYKDIYEFDIIDHNKMDNLYQSDDINIVFIKMKKK